MPKSYSKMKLFEKSLEKNYKKMPEIYKRLTKLYDELGIPDMEVRHLIALTALQKENLIDFHRFCCKDKQTITDYLESASTTPADEKLKKTLIAWHQKLSESILRTRILLGWELFTAFDDQYEPLITDPNLLYVDESQIKGANLGLFSSKDIAPNQLLGNYPMEGVRVEVPEDDFKTGPYKMETTLVAKKGEFDCTYDVPNPESVPADQAQIHRANMLVYLDPNNPNNILTPNSIIFVAYYAPSQSKVLKNRYVAPAIGAMAENPIPARDEITATYTTNSTYQRSLATLYGASSLEYITRHNPPTAPIQHSEAASQSTSPASEHPKKRKRDNSATFFSTASNENEASVRRSERLIIKKQRI